MCIVHACFQVVLFAMMTSSNGNIFRVTGSLCGEFTGRRWIPHTKASDTGLWYFLRSADSLHVDIQCQQQRKGHYKTPLTSTFETVSSAKLSYLPMNMGNQIYMKHMFWYMAFAVIRSRSPSVSEVLLNNMRTLIFVFFSCHHDDVIK